MAIGFIPVIIVGGFALVQSREALLQQALNQLESVREIKKAQLEIFFAERKGDMQVLVNTLANFRQKAFQKLESIHEHKKALVDLYFHERLSDISVLSQNEAIANAL